MNDQTTHDLRRYVDRGRASVPRRNMPDRFYAFCERCGRRDSSVHPVTRGWRWRRVSTTKLCAKCSGGSR